MVGKYHRFSGWELDECGIGLCQLVGCGFRPYRLKNGILISQ
jgi:hypothetical protein